jgi:hypothetical protein
MFSDVLPPSFSWSFPSIGGGQWEIEDEWDGSGQGLDMSHHVLFLLMLLDKLYQTQQQ